MSAYGTEEGKRYLHRRRRRRLRRQAGSRVTKRPGLKN